MADQAQGLRDLLHTSKHPGKKQTRMIAVTSGKGGVGKSNFTLNFALTLQAQGYKVLVFDADIGMANIDVLMGVRPEYSLHDLLRREKRLHDILCKGHNELLFISGGSGLHDLLQLSESELDTFTQELELLNGEMDFILFDTGAGLSRETLHLIMAAQETIIVTTPEPTAITDAYATVKMVTQTKADVAFRLVVNRVSDQREGKQTAEKLQLAAKRFLEADISTLGFVPDDHHVSKAVKMQTPFTVAYPNSAAARGMRELAYSFLRTTSRQDRHRTGVRSFLRRMAHLLKS